MSASILRILLTVLICGVVSTMPVVGGTVTTRDASSSAQTGRAIPESAAGLQLQLETILRTAKSGDSKQFEDLVNELQVPENANWFATTFGEETGARPAATYRMSWEVYKDQIAKMFHDSGTIKHSHVFVKEFSSSSAAPTDTFVHAILQNAKGPVVLYTAGAGKDRESDSLPGVYVYVQGAFRVVNWRAFYDLPNVKPMRIRVSSSVAQAQLVHQVNPTLPAGARQQHGQGTVVLHTVIDRDGNVARVEAVSGPPELIQAAVEAVRQWRFKPTVLNGDPVEMDTTFTITFSFGG
jgi:TonB family protein